MAKQTQRFRRCVSTPTLADVLHFNALSPPRFRETGPRNAGRFQRREGTIDGDTTWVRPYTAGLTERPSSWARIKMAVGMLPSACCRRAEAACRIYVRQMTSHTFGHAWPMPSVWTQRTNPFHHGLVRRIPAGWRPALPTVLRENKPAQWAFKTTPFVRA